MRFNVRHAARQMAAILPALGLMFLAASCAKLGLGPQAEPTFVNPIVPQRADAAVEYHSQDGYYYFAATVPEYDRLEIRRAKTIQGLGAAEPKVIWRRHASGPMSGNIWAPEIRFVNGKWIVYFSAGNGKGRGISGIRLYALENDSPDPWQGTWVERGQVKTNWESFALDPTTFELKGTRYLVWAQKEKNIGGSSNIYIAKMDSPTSITGKQVRLSNPTLPWECQRYRVNEGPAVLIHGGKVFLTYSGSATDWHYCLGMLTASADADLLDAKSWTKSPEPVFATNEANKVFGPGHNSFTTTPDGKTDVLIYHARSYKEIRGNELANPDRSTRAQVIHWRHDGTPDFGVPVACTGPLGNAGE